MTISGAPKRRNTRQKGITSICEVFEKCLDLFYLTGNTAITMSTLQSDKKPTISGFSTWEYTK